MWHQINRSAASIAIGVIVGISTVSVAVEPAPAPDRDTRIHTAQTGLTAFQLAVLSMLEQLLEILGEPEERGFVVQEGTVLDVTAQELIQSYQADGVSPGLPHDEADKHAGIAANAKSLVEQPESGFDPAMRSQLSGTLDELRAELEQLSSHE